MKRFTTKFLPCINPYAVQIHDAALYWFLRMIDGGADPLYMGRRIVRMAIEDIGLADPKAQTLALEACQIYERLGSPEGELALSKRRDLFGGCTQK